MKIRNLIAATTLGFSLALVGCGGGDAPAATAGGGSATARNAAAPSVTPTGNVVEVKMISAPGKGEVFEPADFTVQRGDVVRFVLVSGVHNASFTPANNPSGITLPPNSPYLQAPGQTFEFTVDQPAGTYYYQCDPHVALGMVGHMTVVD